MSSTSQNPGLSWTARLLIALALMFVGAAAAAWTFARYDDAARFFGITRAATPQLVASPPPPQPAPQNVPTGQVPPERVDQRIAQLEARLAQVENAAQRVEGSAGRADGLLIAFSARRAVDRGVRLGFLEPLLVDRFGSSHPRAVATIITGAHSPVRLSDLIAEYRQLGPTLRSSAPEEGPWVQFKRELASLVQIRRADQPSGQADARYMRALSLLDDGEVDAALAETMRLPGAPRADGWVRKARRYVAVRRALDEIESAALLGRSPRSAA